MNPANQEDRSLGRPTRDTAGFWEYGVWDKLSLTVERIPTKELLQVRLEVLGPGDRYVGMRRWIGGWEKV